jgi:signal transduction histidine kinase
MAYLDMLEGFHCGKQVLLPDTAVIGRHPESFLCLPDTRVSRQHARILRRGTTFVIEDLQSSNGVIVQDTRLVPHLPSPLHDGDEIRIGCTRMVFRDDRPLPQPCWVEHDRASYGGHAESVMSGRTCAGEGGTLRVHMRADDATQPNVALTLDASVNMLEVSEVEQHTAQGLREALKRLQALCQVSTALGTITDRETLLQQILDCLFAIFPAAERAFILLRDAESDTLVPAAARGQHHTAEQQDAMAISRTIVQEVMLHKRAILSVDALDDTRFHGHDSVIDLAIRSMMCAPLLANDELLGLVQVDTCTTPGGFTAEDLQMLTGISAQAAILLRARAAEQAQEALRRAQAAAEESHQAKSMMLATMSHELRTPLNAILGYSELLIEDAAALEQSTMVANLRKIHSAGTRLLTLINDVLDLSKLEAGKMGLHLETFDVWPLLEEVQAMVQPAVHTHANALEITVANNVGLMHADLSKVRQSLLNLLSNACKFTTRGCITLQVTREKGAGNDWYLFDVRDTGIGLTAEQLETLFQEYVQGDAATAQQYGGTGLGLAISRRFCRLMGGDIAAASTWGQGTTFTIRLPVVVRAHYHQGSTGAEASPHGVTITMVRTPAQPSTSRLADDPAAGAPTPPGEVDCSEAGQGV